jgi:CrcB protein
VTIDPDAPADRRSLRQEWDVLVAIAIGGVIGAECRYGIDRWLPPGHDGFPWATFTINVLGCLLMGALMVVLTEIVAAHRLARPFLGVGILGGFTTFSSFAVDAERLIDARRDAVALTYVAGTLVVAAVALALGTQLARTIGRRFSRPGPSGRRPEPQAEPQPEPRPDPDVAT